MKVAFLFPGQGSQQVGMGKNLCENFKAAKLAFEEASDALSFDMKKLCFEGPEKDLTLTENTQPAVLTASVAALRAFESESACRASVAAGHSLGEYSALVAAGAIGLADAVRIVRKRGQFMQQACPEGEGAMAAVIGLDAQKLGEILKQSQNETGKTVVAANFNAPDQIAISGHKAAVDRACELVKASGKKAIPLSVSAPFHSPLMAPSAEKLAEVLADANFKSAAIKVVANVDAVPYSEPSEARDVLKRQVASPVLWTACVAKLRDFAVEGAIEFGPGKIVTGLVKRIDKDLKCIPVGDFESLKAAIEAGFK